MNQEDQSNVSRGLRLRDLLTLLSVLCLLVLFPVLVGLSPSTEPGQPLPGMEYDPPWARTARNSAPLQVLDTDGALGRRNRKPKQLALRDMARVHGHLCDGLVISWVELGVALRALFPDRIVDRTDLRIVSKNGPCWADAAAWTTGARINHGTLVLDASVGDGFIVQRISTGQAVQVRLRPGIFPAELADLEHSIRVRRAAGEPVTPEEIDRVEALANELSKRLLNVSPDDVVQLEPLPEFTFPVQGPGLVTARSDIINRNLPRATKTEGVSR